MNVLNAIGFEVANPRRASKIWRHISISSSFTSTSKNHVSHFDAKSLYYCTNDR